MKLRVVVFMVIALVTVLISFQQGFVIDTLHSRMESFGLQYQNSSEKIVFPFSYVAKNVKVQSNKIPYSINFDELNASPLLTLTGLSEDGSLKVSSSLFQPSKLEINAENFGLSSAIPELFNSGMLTGALSGDVKKEVSGQVQIQSLSVNYPPVPSNAFVNSASFEIRANKKTISIDNLSLDSTLGSANGWIQFNPTSSELNGNLDVSKVDATYSGLLASLARGKKSEKYELIFKLSNKGVNSFKVIPK